MKSHAQCSNGVRICSKDTYEVVGRFVLPDEIPKGMIDALKRIECKHCLKLVNKHLHKNMRIYEEMIRIVEKNLVSEA